MLEACPAIAFAAATDLVRARRFYEGTLGLRVEDDGPFACVLRAGDVMVRVARVDRLTPQPFTVLGFDVDDIRHQVAELVQRGVAFRRFDGMDQDASGIWTTPTGDMVAWFTDPDGNTLSLTQFA